MKIGGVDPKDLSSEDFLILPRKEGEIVFRAQSVKSMDEFIQSMPEPKVPVKRTREGIVDDFENKDYKTTMEAYSKRRLGYLVVKSLEPSQIEWDTVQPEVPGTWINWEQDLKQGGLSQVEVNHVLRLVLEVNALDEGKLKKARELFLQGPQPALAT